jgi:hypothetical protein
MNSVYALANSPRMSLAFVSGLIVMWVLLGSYYDTLPRHNYHWIRYCDGRISNMTYCANGLYPQSGAFVAIQNTLKEYPLLGLILVLVQWELPLLATVCVLYLYMTRRRVNLDIRQEQMNGCAL